MLRRTIPIVALFVASSSAWAQAPGLDDGPGDVEFEDGDDEVAVRERLEALEDRLEHLESQLEQQRKKSIEPKPISLEGFFDFGFFAPVGSGVGWAQDFGNQAFEEYRGQYGWVFYGDILATTINSRGEVADLGDAPGAERFDSVDSNGAPGFIANEINLRVNVALSRALRLTTSVNFVPRSGSEFDLGDFLDIDIAQLEWMFTDDAKHSFFVGKIEPVFGIEYKERRADTRFGITPSLVQRYTSGPQLGLKLRSKLFDDWLLLAAAFTNGSSTIEQFHFYDEVDSNAGKTLSARAAMNVPLGRFFDALDGHQLEIGVSGELGTQDRAQDNIGSTWFAGVDFEYRADGLSVKGQWMRGFSEGSAIDRVWSLDLSDSGYLEVDWMIIPELGVIVRGGLRDAFVALADERAYITRSWRLTAGLRVVITNFVILKAEFLHNGEYGGVPEIDNDVFTSSLVLRY